MKTRSSSSLALALIVVAAAACSMLKGPTPTDTFKAFFDASQKNDVPGMKKQLSKSTLDMFEGLAKLQNKSVDEALKDIHKNDKAEKMPETRNEKINGDSATLEVKNDQTGKWDTLPFVKEDKQWKIAFDKFMEETLKGMGKEMPNIK